MLKTSVFQLQLVCPGCNNNIAVSGITDFDTCQNCGKHVNVSAAINDKMFGFMDKTKYMNGYLSGSIEQMGGSGAYKLVYSSGLPYCEECFTAIEEETAMNAINSGKAFTCPKCEHKMPVRAADAILKEFHPKSVGVLNDSFGKDHAEKNTEKELLLVFKCMTCGAGLELSDDTDRKIKCKYCDNENYLPDSIWMKLHPNKEVQPLFVILDLSEAELKGSIDYFLKVTALNVFSKHFNNFIREFFEKPFVNPAFLSWLRSFLSAKNNEEISFNMDITKIQKYFYDNLKLGLSSHPVELRITSAEFGNGLPIELQKELSVDPDEKVRIALAKNNGLKKEIIKKLQADSSNAVQTEAKKLKTGFFKELFG
jgi:DNA-directed RNA polymerase subunit RPC12/RpoP